MKNLICHTCVKLARKVIAKDERKEETNMIELELLIKSIYSKIIYNSTLMNKNKI